MPKHSSKKSTHQKAPPKQPLYRSRPPPHSHYTPVYIPKEPTHKPRVINLDDERPSSPLAPDQYPRRSSFRYNDNSTEVLISDFRFIPDFIEVSMDSIVKWRIDRNETIHRSGIYGSETRSFVISVQHGNEHFESELLSKDQTFSYRFERAGTYHIKCANYPQIQGVVQVCGTKDNNSCSGLSSIAAEQVGSLSSCNEEDSKGQTATAVAVEKKPLEVKESPLFLLKDFGNEGIQELILELSLQSTSSKEGVSSKDGKGIDSNSEELDQTTKRYSMVKDQLLRKTEVNIFDELVSREFNGLKLKPRENGYCEMAQKNIKTSIEIEEEALLVTASSRIEEKNSEHSGEREEQHNFEHAGDRGGNLPVLYSRKNPKDEEQKFDQAMTHSQECSEGDEEEEEYVDNGKKFLEFIKDGVKNVKEKYRNRSRRGNKNRRKSSYKGPDEEEMEKIEALKAFLTSRFEFAEEFDT